MGRFQFFLHLLGFSLCDNFCIFSVIHTWMFVTAHFSFHCTHLPPPLTTTQNYIQLMEDFDDVSAKEKILIKLWNKFIKSHTTTSDRSIPSKCKTFIASHLQPLVTDDLRQNLLLHLYNLWDSGLISSNCILSCMELYDDGVEGKNEEEDRDNEGKSSCSQTKTPKRKNIPLSIAPSLHSSGSKRIKRGWNSGFFICAYTESIFFLTVLGMGDLGFWGDLYGPHFQHISLGWQHACGWLSMWNGNLHACVCVNNTL